MTGPSVPTRTLAEAGTQVILFAPGLHPTLGRTRLPSKVSIFNGWVVFMCRFCCCFAGSRADKRTPLHIAFAVLLVLTPVVSPALLAQTGNKQHRKVVQMVDPDYPTVLRNGHFQGLVIIEATVQPNGNVSKVDIKGGNPMLSQYAAAAVSHWKYAPGPDKTVEEVTFHFNANDR